MVDLLDAARSGVEHVRKKLGPDDDWMPTLFVLDKNDDVTIVGVPPAGGSDVERELLWQSTVPSLLVGARATEVVVIFTSWVSHRTEDEPPLVGRPSDDPNRREMLTLVHVTPASEQIVMAEILRGTKHPRLRWDDDANVTALGGRVMAAIRRGLLS